MLIFCPVVDEFIQTLNFVEEMCIYIVVFRRKRLHAD